MTEKKKDEPTTAIVSNPHVLVGRMIEKGVDPDALKKMMDIAERWQAQQALVAFNVGMNECQKAMPAVVRNVLNAHTKKKYADLEAVNDAIKPVYTSAGFSVAFSEDACPTLGSVRLVATLQHVGGHAARYWTDVPLDGSGVKGNANMTATQGKGSTLAYARRYLLHLIFNLTIADEDNDGNATVGTLDQDQVKVVNELLEDCKTEGSPVDYKKFLAWALGDGVEGDLGNVPASEFARLVEWLNRKLRKVRAEKATKGDAAE